jgi:hypothetical protein
MKNDSINPVITTVKRKGWKTIFWPIALSLIGATTTAYAVVENCPDPTSIRFDEATYEWRTTQRGWLSNSRPRNTNGLGVPTLKAVKLRINQRVGDVAECAYEAANGEKLVFFKGMSATDSSGAVIIRTEIVPVNEKEWNNDAVRDEFVCQPFLNKCAFDIVVHCPVIET